jgi:hypothetical protein
VVARQGGVLSQQLERVEVPALRLDELIEHHSFSDLDLLQSEREGYDGEGLQAIDLSRHRPRLIRFEHGNIARADFDALERRLADHDYPLFRGGRFADSLAMPAETLAQLA